MSAPEWRLRVEELKRLALPRGREALGRFSLEGFRSMERALRQQSPLREVVVSERFARAGTRREQAILEEVRKRDLPLRVAPDLEVAALTGGRGLGEVFGILDLPPPTPWEQMIRPSGRSLLVVGWNLEDPGNTGAVIRSALASGASGFIAVGVTDPWHPKAVRTSMGSLFALPLRRVEDNADWLDVLESLKFETFASVCRQGESLPGVRPKRDRLALIMGSEAFGLPDEIADRMHRRLTIPMPEGVDSFSVNAAAAVLAFHLITAPRAD